MAQSLDEFIAELKTQVEQFASQYRECHARHPEMFPLSMDSGNEGLWMEFFFEFNPDVPMDAGIEPSERDR